MENLTPGAAGRSLFSRALIALLLLCAARAGAQEAPLPAGAGGRAGSAAATPTLPAKIAEAVVLEGKRYAHDSVGLFTAPLHWDATDWKKAAGVGLVLGGLFAADRHLNYESQAHRSATTNSVSNFVQPMGGAGALGLSAALVVGGLAAHSSNTEDAGREAIEASVITGLLNNLVLKPAFGRERPYVSGGQTTFEPVSKNYSFPSGDASEAFSVASVVAMRAHGWVVPTLAYTAATLVAFERVNKNVHFPSDVFAGAVLGTVTGRYLVSRHEREEGEEASGSGMSLSVAPTLHGLSVDLRF